MTGDPSVAAWIAAIREVQDRDYADHVTARYVDEADEPGESVISETDLDWLADRYADREEQFMRGEN